VCAVAEWKGELVVEGGGFCGISSAQCHDLSAYDGAPACLHCLVFLPRRMSWCSLQQHPVETARVSLLMNTLTPTSKRVWRSPRIIYDLLHAQQLMHTHVTKALRCKIANRTVRHISLRSEREDTHECFSTSMFVCATHQLSGEQSAGHHV
jgi:hypothetical protein